jgi:3-hydroxyacyl-CoA dehydrogenase
MPSLQINKAVVIGAGTMGAQIAAHLANVGIPVLLLDQLTELTTDDQAKGLSLKDPQIRNRHTQTLFDRAQKLSPPPFFTQDSVKRVRIGNTEDDIASISDADWIVEAVFERLDVKQAIHEKISTHARASAIVTTNTSGIPLADIVEKLPLERRKRFFGTHFFNPPRYMRLLELVSISETDPQLRSDFAEFAEEVLGKGIVYCKDVPGFISNRIGFFAIQHAIWLTTQENLTIDEVDAWTGPLIGRPRSATFRLADVIGLDVVDLIGRNLCEALPSDDGTPFFKQPSFAQEMLRQGWRGQKTKIGYYQKVKTDTGSQILSLDLKKLKHLAPVQTSSENLKRLSNVPNLKDRLQAVFDDQSNIGSFLWKHLSAVLCYSANHVHELTDDIVSVDRVMKWGFNWEIGPFEIWDALEIEKVVNRLEQENRPVPSVVQKMLKQGRKSFYELRGTKKFFIDLKKLDFVSVSQSPHAIDLSILKKNQKLIQGNAGASLIDLGEGILCLEFHNKLNLIGSDQLEMVEKASTLLQKDFQGLVIGNESDHFSAGGNLTDPVRLAEAQQWEDLRSFRERFFRCIRLLESSTKPIVAACKGYTLGQGCDITFATDFVVAYAETYFGLPEARIGLIPDACACKEMVARWTNNLTNLKEITQGILEAWKCIFLCKTSSSAEEAFQFRFLVPEKTKIVLNRDWVLGRARETALNLIKQKDRKELSKPKLPAVGQHGLKVIGNEIQNLLSSGKISQESKELGEKLALVLCGGNGEHLEWKNEDHFLTLGSETMLDLFKNPKTLEKIREIL